MTRNSKRRLAYVAAVTVLAAWVYFDSRPTSSPASADLTAPSALPAKREKPAAEDPSAPLPAISGKEAANFVHAINRYAPGSRRLTDESHDLLNPGARHERRQRLPNDRDDPDPGWEVLFTADRFYINGDDRAIVTLQLWHEGQPVTPAQVSLVAETGEAGRAPLNLRTERTSDAVRAAFVPDTTWPDYAGPVTVTAQFSAEGMMTQSGTIDFHFTGSERNPGVFTGQFGERLVNGNLVFDIGVDVHDAGRFRIEANLFDALGRPFGWAQFDGMLGKGRQFVALTYDGLMFHDTQAQAPFLLTRVRGYRLAPEHRSGRQSMPSSDLAYATRGGYNTDDFRDFVQLSPRQQRMQELYEDARRRGVKLTEPEYTGN